MHRTEEALNPEKMPENILEMQQEIEKHHGLKR
jgi:hypothetical protein